MISVNSPDEPLRNSSMDENDGAADVNADASALGTISPEPHSSIQEVGDL